MDSDAIERKERIRQFYRSNQEVYRNYSDLLVASIKSVADLLSSTSYKIQIAQVLEDFLKKESQEPEYQGIRLLSGKEDSPERIKLELSHRFSEIGNDFGTAASEYIGLARPDLACTHYLKAEEYYRKAHNLNGKASNSYEKIGGECREKAISARYELFCRARRRGNLVRFVSFGLLGRLR